MKAVLRDQSVQNPTTLGMFATPVFLLKWQNHHANHEFVAEQII